jgi:glutathione S-transferase
MPSPTTAPTIVLHQWAISPFCGKVRRILDHKGLAFTTVDYNGLKARGAAKLTPTGKLPVIDYDGERVADSSEIARFLDERHPTPPLYPADPVARARVHFWEDWADEALYWFEIYFRFMYPAAREQAVALLSEGRPAFERMLLGRVVRGMYRKKVTAQGLGRLTQAQVEARFLAHLDALEVLLGESAWLAGDARTIADIAVASQLAEIVRTGHIAGEVTGRPKLGAWLSRS